MKHQPPYNPNTLVVIGGGAAGFFCAINAAAASPMLKVILLEKTGKLLSKVKVSGGGRCNVTHDCTSVSELLKNYPRGQVFLKKAFHHFSATDTVKWFAERGVKLKTEADGRMFPTTDSSQTIIDCLLSEANELKIDILMQSTVEEVKASGNRFEIMLSGGKKITADKVCLACGGLSHSNKFDWLNKLGHKIVSPLPSLFTFNLPGDTITQLMGVTLSEVQVKIAGTKLEQKGPLLITHWGMSGPAILKLSAWGARTLADMNYQATLLVNWLPHYHENSLREELQKIRFSIATQKIGNRNPLSLPSRLWEYLLVKAGINPEIRWADLPAKEQNALAKLVTSQQFQLKGKTTFKEEFVTAGGIDLTEVNPHTMESRIVPGLYFAGEILDVDGVTGGFNFQNAWTTGYLAARHIADGEKVQP